MDIVTDLTQETIAYLSLIQDIYKHKENCGALNSAPLTEESYKIWNAEITLADINKEDVDFVERVREIVFVSKRTAYNTALLEKMMAYFLTTAKDLVDWLESNRIGAQFEEEPQHTSENANKNPAYWRKSIRHLLYTAPERRESLIRILHYMPILVIYVLSKRKANKKKILLQQEIDYRNQRLYQFFNFRKSDDKISDGDKKSLLLIDGDQQKWKDWWHLQLPTDGEEKTVASPDLAITLATNDHILAAELRKHQIAIPFEILFPLELDELMAARKFRNINTKNNGENQKIDPFVRARQMKLRGLAFSGGGIRSATFNLGVLQKLASLGFLDKFDYISTVSGGGYIGAWFISWIKRSGSLEKVEHRLNPTLSTDPLAEEVRPIRWLRMYSNYLAPNASLMSTDSWTVGVTWLRNTLVNLSVLLLLFVTALGFIQLFYTGWAFLHQKLADSRGEGWLWASSFTCSLLIAWLAGNGMRYFDKATDSKAAAIGTNKYLPYGMLATAVIASFPLSAWFAGNIHNTVSLYDKFKFLFLPIGVSLTLGMLIIAALGKYHYRQKKEIEILENAFVKSIKSRYKKVVRKVTFKKNDSLPSSDSPSVVRELYQHTNKIIIAIFSSSVIAALIGVSLLAVTWHIIPQLTVFSTWLYKLGIISKQDISFYLQLMLGVPLILEVLSITVVIRMIFMGKLFPDARREWWGRIGAITHRFMFFWILVFSSALIIPFIFEGPWFKKHMTTLPLVTGGWTAVILAAVKMAFNSGSAENASKKGINFKEAFIRFAPYLFLIGFLLIASNIYNLINAVVAKSTNWILYLIFHHKEFPWINGVTATLLVAAITLFLSWRVGINEFSLHHFYRNRLVRAYLGGTRRRISRENTVNTLTGFDAEDDLKLAKFTTSHQYKGPYPIINTALNATSVSDLDRQDRKAESFIFSPLFCGYDFSPTRSAAYTQNKAYEYGYRETELYATTGGPSLGTAMAISGAAVNPNMGYHSSAPTAFLLTMFNLRLGWWIGNPRSNQWKRSEPKTGINYLVKDVIGKSDIDTDYVCLSDGGHFDNMGIYELIRRKCDYILLCDAEEDSKATCEGLANAIRRCRIDFGVEIEIGIEEIFDADNDSHFIMGEISYPGQEKKGQIVYVKASLKPSATVDVREYAKNNTTFPQQSTGDQFYDEAQFESYRKLGYDSISKDDNIGL